MEINGVEVEDTFAEAFEMYLSRVVITAYNSKLAEEIAKEVTGFATSIIMCPAEAGIEKRMLPEETLDKRSGISVLIGHVSMKELKKQLIARIGQCVLTAPTANAFDGMPTAEERFDVGNKLRYFGDGFEKCIELEGRKVWEIPIMEGTFLVENDFGIVKGVAGGNILIMGENQPAALEAAFAAVDAIKDFEGVITPFPCGVVASGSKVGSKYKFLKASTNEKFAPTLKGIVETEIPDNVNAVYEVVINGVSKECVEKAMGMCIKAATRIPGVVKISAANFGGKLGKYKIWLRDVLEV